MNRRSYEFVPFHWTFHNSEMPVASFVSSDSQWRKHRWENASSLCGDFVDIPVYICGKLVVGRVLSADWVCLRRSSFESWFQMFWIVAAMENENGNFNLFFYVFWSKLLERGIFFLQMEVLKFLNMILDISSLLKEK